LEEFRDRLLFELDLGSGDRHLILTRLVEYYRAVLAQLRPEAAEMMAFRNAESLAQIDHR
jgi:hypothetical protein